MNDNNFPLVSILMPLYNEEKYIQQALISLLQQDYPNIEILIQDNNSTDKTLEQIIPFLNRFPDKIKVESNPKTVIAFENFRAVLKRASGKYCFFCAGHDLWDQSFISTCIEPMENDDNILLVNPHSQWIDTENNCIGEIQAIWQGFGLSTYSRFMMMLHNYYHQFYGLYRTEKIQYVFNNVSQLDILGPDHLVNLALAVLGECYYIPKTLFYMRKNDDFANNQVYLEKVFGKKFEGIESLNILLDMFTKFLPQLRFFLPENPLERNLLESAVVQYVFSRHSAIMINVAENVLNLKETNPHLHQLIINLYQNTLPAELNHVNSHVEQIVLALKSS